MQRTPKVGDELVCIKDGILGYRLDNYYKVDYVSWRTVGVMNDVKYSNAFYSEVYEDECVAYLWDYFGSIKDIRKKKLKKLKIFSDEENSVNLYCNSKRRKNDGYY